MINKCIQFMKHKKINLQGYFKDTDNEIEMANFYIFRGLSIATIVVILLFSAITKLVIPRWKPTIFHMVFLILSVVFMGISLYLNQHRTMIKDVGRLVCGSYLAMLMFFFGLLDTIPASQTGQIFVAIFLVAAPVLFIVPFFQMFIFQTVFLIYFISMTYHFKADVIARTDTLGVVIAFIISQVIYGIVMNIRVQEYLEKKSYKLSSELDPLTGLANRTSCKNRVNTLLEKKNTNVSCALLVMDIDDFKGINDTHGHATGDEVLVDVSNILMNVFRKTDVVGRFGGDEFVVFIKDYENIAVLNRKCREINELLEHVMETRLQVSCSMGLCVLETGTTTLEEMFKVADAALYEAKIYKHGKHVIREFNQHEVDIELPRMVVADDVMVDRESIAIQFEDEFQVEKFANSKEALVYIWENARNVDIVMLDMMMPGMNGIELLQKLKSNQDTKRIPVVAISADEHTEENALLYGADDMLTKPIDPAVAKLRVKNVMKKAGKW